MTRICAIYSCFNQTRQPILSLTSSAIRVNSQIHVRRNSVLTCAYDTTIVKPALRKVQTSSQFHSVKSFGGSLTKVSIYFVEIFLRFCSKFKRKVQKIARQKNSIKVALEIPMNDVKKPCDWKKKPVNQIWSRCAIFCALVISATCL